MNDESAQVICDAHGKARTTYVCSHLAADPEQRWHGDYPSDDNPWPDSWCDRCNVAFLREGEWNDRNAGEVKLSVLCHHCYERARGRSVARLTDTHLASWQSFVDDCHRELGAKQDRLKRDYSLDVHKRWDWDQERAELVFSNDGVAAVIAKVQFVGSISTKTDTWLWSWANPSLLENVWLDVKAIRDFGEKRDFPHLTVPKWPAEEADGWDMAAIATHILDAHGVYRTPGDTGFTFLVLTEVRFAQ